MRLSVCIPAHDESAGIAETLGDVLASDLGNHELLEVLVYDDASTDDTAAVVERIASARALVRLIRGGRRAGTAGALNALYGATQGDVVVKLDADVRLEPDAIRLLADEIGGGATTAIGTGKWSASRNTPVASGAAFAMSLNRRLQLDPLAGIEYVPGRCVALAGAFARALRVPGDVINEDRYTTSRARAAGGTVVLVDEARYRFSVVTTFADYRAQSSRIRRGDQHLEQAYGAERRSVRRTLSAFAHTASRDPFGALCWSTMYVATLLMAPAPNSPAWRKAATTKGTR